jgi:hypothetical protein
VWKPSRAAQERASHAAKFVDHNLAEHSSVYQRRFDAHEMEMESLQAVLSAAS